MPLTGAFVRKAFRFDPVQSQLHESDSEEHTLQFQETVSPPEWKAPLYHDTGMNKDPSGEEWVTDAVGIVLPEAPSSHVGGDHAVEAGGAAGRNFRDVALQFSNERYETHVAEGQPGSVSTISEVALRRGLNAELQNNEPQSGYGGEIFRRGEYRMWNVFRNFKPPLRSHELRIVIPPTAAAAGDAPPPSPSGPYNSPFSSLARAIRNINVTPALRRTPERIDEAVISAEPSTPDVFLETWVVQ